MTAKTSTDPSESPAKPVSNNISILKPGAEAPDFCLNSTPDQKVSLSEFRGKNVILAFYPADWSPVCGDELALFNELVPDFQKLNAELLAISVDGIWSHLAFAHDRKFHFPLLADFEPRGAAAQTYGVYRKLEGTDDRALFVIDKEGIVRWSYLSPVGVNPGADGILSALEAIENATPAASAKSTSGKETHVTP